MGAGPGAARAMVPLVGRDKELAELRAGLEDALSGMGGLFMATGEAGIGKTRLVEALVATAHRTGVPACWGRCWEGGGAPAYWPWAQVVQACLRLRDTSLKAQLCSLGRGAGDIVRFVPELSAQVPDLVSPPTSDSPGGRLRLFDAVTSLLRDAAADPV